MKLSKAPSVFAVLIGWAMVPALGAGVRPWKPAGISSPQFESHAAFDPKTGDLYFVRSSPEFQGWRILVSRCTAKGWSEPKPPGFAGDGVEADPYFTPDGRSLYFISTRSVNGMKRKDLDIWRVDRGADGAWGVPARLPEPVNSTGAEWFPRPGPHGWLYFGSNRPGGFGLNDIWRARADAAGGWIMENLGAAVNTAGDEYEPLPSPDGSRMIVMADGGLYETRKTETGWSPRTKLGPEVNSNGTEIGALFSPSGRSLLFARDTKGPASGEFFVWHEIGVEDWPPECPPIGADHFWALEEAASVVQAPKDNEELSRLHDQDQADRTPPDGRSIDWAVVAPRDKARLKRVKEMYVHNLLQTADDYYHAALVLQHGDTADDPLLAHEFCVIAISKGKNDREAKWLAAASEDRFLMNIGRPQRFGTQYRSDEGGPMRVYEVGPGVTDETRRAMGVPSLAEAKAHEAEMNKH